MPILTVIAGPNGAGKSTLTQFVDFEGRDRLLDPDAIAFQLNPPNPTAVAITAAKHVLARTAAYLDQHVSFAVETTLSSRGRVDLLRVAKSRDFRVHLVFIGMDSPERCIARIRYRAERGGHPVPEADVRRRYARSVANAAIALRLADLARCYDNSGDGPQLVLVADAGQVTWRAESAPEWLKLLVADLDRGVKDRARPNER